jgi:hypothetical protein
MSNSDKALAFSLSAGAPLGRASELRAAASTRVWRLDWPALDAALLGGVPRGQVTEWAGPRSAGKTAALRQLVHAVREAGAGAAYVDGTGTLAPAAWVRGVPGPDGAAPFWVVRPPASGVLAAADELLRSGAFGLVIAEGAEGAGAGAGAGAAGAEAEVATEWKRAPVIRLQRLAREAGAALVAVVGRPGQVPQAGLRVEFSTDPGFRSCRVRVGGHGRPEEISLVQDVPYRLPEDAGLPDRLSARADERRRLRVGPESGVVEPERGCLARQVEARSPP